ncbi:retrovirus-related pol polyprotein from transposon TNT 1-94 [Tanacetum coccineum]
MVNTSFKELNVILLALIWLSKKEPLPPAILRARGGLNIQRLAVEQHRLESRTLEVKMNQVLSENERLLAQAIDHDIVKTVVNLSVNDGCFTQLFKLSELRAQSQEKDTVIVKLKEQIKSLKGNVDDSKVKMDMDEIETLNMNWNNRVQNLFEQGLVIAALKNELRKLKGKALDKEAIKTHSVDPKVSKDIPRFHNTVLNTRVVHSTGVRLSTSASGSQPSGNTKNDKIQQTQSSNSKNKVEAHSRNVKSSLNKRNGTVKVNGSASVQNSKKQDNSNYIVQSSYGFKTKSWLWHRRLFHLNFGAINHLARHGLVRGLPKLKFEKDHLCSAYALGKSSKKPTKPNLRDTNKEKLYLLDKDLCGLVVSQVINGKTTLREYYEKVAFSHETSVERSSQQNGVVKR